jgi:hypothetical protein
MSTAQLAADDLFLDESLHDGWFYKEAGHPVGPCSIAELTEFLAVGRIRTGQPVWKRDGAKVTFVRAAATTLARVR